MPGPLPNPQKRRRNAPTIPTTALPVAGRDAPAPDPPYELGVAGVKWWAWAWALPQATVWDAGSLYALARRAQLEDDLLSLAEVEEFDLAELLGIDDDREMGRRLDGLVRRLKGLAGGRVSVMREMRELDNRFGLNPKGMADLRWSIEPEDDAEAPKLAEVRSILAVDPKVA